MIAAILAHALTNVRAQGDGDGWTSYFNALFEQYKDQTGDSLFGPIPGNSPEARAHALFSSENYAEAIPQLDKLLAKWPTGWNYFRRGYCHYMLKNYQVAVVDLTKSIARFPEPLLSPWWVGPTVYQEEEDGKYEKRIGVSLVYQYIDAYLFRAESKLQLGDYYGCIADVAQYFSQMDAKAKRFPEQERLGWCMSGYSKIMTEDLRGAISDFQAAIEIDPEDGQSHYYLGVIHIEIGEVPEGCRALSRAGELGFTDAYSLIKEHCGGK